MPKNTLVIMSDEHASTYMGCAGHPFAKTPHLDALAAEACRFTNAYTNSPICLPARAAFATGRYAHETRFWDNAHPYDGSFASWGHVLKDHGVRSVSIGKLHYRDAETYAGFDEQIVPMHVVGGHGDLLGCVRDELPRRMKCKALSDDIGVGESPYTRYDRNITELACQWLSEQAKNGPWVLYVGLVAPHFPLIAPEAFYQQYADLELSMPKAYAEAERTRHPWLDQWRECWISDEFFDDHKVLEALRCYLGLVSFLDHNVGRILDALDSSGEAGNTQVIYTSDHGDNLGARGLWGKSTLYEEAAAVPMILKSPEKTLAKTCETPVSLVDVAQTLVSSMGAEVPATWRGDSLLEIAEREYDPERIVFSEYHAAGAISGAFMLRQGHYKYVHYVGYPAQLFDLAEDPEEMVDLADDPAHQARLKAFERKLLSLCDPKEIDRVAKQDQRDKLAAHGGREAIVAQGGFGATPAPGDQAKYAS